MGILDLPAPLYLAVDHWLASALPPAGRFVLWGVVAGALSMIVYHLLAPRGKIEASKRRLADARRRLWEEEEFARALPLIGTQLGAAFKRAGLALPASLLALLPVMTVAIWLDTAYGHTLDVGNNPPGAVVRPDGFDARVIAVPQGAPRLEVRPRGIASEPLVQHEMTAAVTRVEKRRWWNALIGNPAGYLPEDGPVESVVLDLPPREYLSFGPRFVRSWPMLFFAAVTLASLLLHRALKRR
ncbi:MAG: hypothetical protein GEU76_05260 [Alphaproteobacteria bacterium]|nr:hypothetical protein [Alphaproteobacteria bacterium]